jgi:hypothetical protein
MFPVMDLTLTKKILNQSIELFKNILKSSFSKIFSSLLFIIIKKIIIKKKITKRVNFILNFGNI